MTQSQPILDYQTPPRKTRKPIFSKKVFRISLAVVGLGLLILTFVLIRAKEKANRDKCAANLSCIGQAIQLHVACYKEPPDQLATLVTTCDLATEIFICPSTTDTPAPANNPTIMISQPGHCSYIYVAKGQTSRWMDDVSHILAYEPLKNHNDEGGHVLFADGSVKWFSTQQMQTLIKELEAGFNPPRGTANASPATGPAKNPKREGASS